MFRVLLVLVTLLPAVALAAVEGPGVEQFIRAARTRDSLTVDGRLHEASWASAPVFDAFVERSPIPGKAPSERTALRVLYDESHVYFGIYCHDSEPQQISRRLGRRDSQLVSDAVHVLIDSMHDHGTAYRFSLTASGVQGDGLFYDDRLYTQDWDGVWDGKTTEVADGWTAEFAIPLSLLRFPAAPMQVWGFAVRRDIARRNEELDSVGTTRTSNAIVSRLGHLTGLEGLSPRRAVELTPYIATRGLLQPSRVLSPSADLGLDLRTALTSELVLNATVNPDFGQVEADQLVLNLTSFETFFAEKRSFFNEGMELFQPVGGAMGEAPQSLIYSRRIGLTAPILAAAKLSGTVAPGVELGVLDAVVAGPGGWEGRQEPERRLRFYPERPLHLGLEDELPRKPPTPTNFLAAVIRRRVGNNSRVGGLISMATPLSGPCTREDAALPPVEQPGACAERGGNAAALDFDFKTDDSAYGVLGQVSGSQAVGGLPELVLRDGTSLRQGDLGFGTYLRAGRFGGEGFRWELGYDHASPTLELNSTGFQRTQNEQVASAALRYARPDGLGQLRELWVNLSGGSRWPTDGRRFSRGSWASLDVSARFPSYDYLGLEVGTELGGYNIREVDLTGIPLQQPDSVYFAIFGDTNGNRPLTLAGDFTVNHHLPAGPRSPTWSWLANLTVAYRPHPALETRLDASANQMPFGPRFIEALGDERYLFGLLDSSFLSLTLRQQWVLARQLTLQGYAQVFTAQGRFASFHEGSSTPERAPILLDALRPASFAGDPGFYETALNLSVVLRWEYRLGSTLYLVYTHARQGTPVPEGEQPPTTLLPAGLGSGPATDALLVKWSYYWSL